MLDPSKNKLHEIFDKVVDIKSKDERDAVLSSLCEEDLETREQIAKLLSRLDNADSFLKPALELSFGFEEREVVSGITEGEFSSVKPGAQIGCYRVTEEIGSGGFGVVYRALQSKPVSREVALKLIKPGMDSRQVLKRFDNERQSLAIMNHDVIANIYDAGTTPTGRPFFAMEYVEGVPINRYCDQNGLDITSRLRVFNQVCEGVRHAHQKGLIHRDLKPANILVTSSSRGHHPKIIDFGIAKSLKQDLTDQSFQSVGWQVLGTPYYMSPEQAQLGQKNVDVRTDVYSLGIVLFELLTGSTPIEVPLDSISSFNELIFLIQNPKAIRPSQRLAETRANRQETLVAIAQSRKATPSTLLKEVAGDLDWIVYKATVKDPEERYETVADMADDIERYLAKDPIKAHPPSRLYQLNRFAAKNRLAISIAAIVVFLLLATTATMAWFAHKTNVALRSESEALQRERSAKNEAFDASKKAAIAKTQAINSRNEAVAAKKTAQEQSEMFRGLYNYHQNILGKLNVSSLGPAVKLADVLAAQRDQLPDLLADQPEKSRGLICHTLGKLFLNISMHRDAWPLLKDAYTLTEENFGPNHRHTLNAMYSLANAYSLLSDFETSNELCLKLISRESNFEPDESELIRVHLLHGGNLNMQQDFKNALSAYKEAGALGVARYGRTSIPVMRAAIGMAQTFQKCGRIVRALEVRDNMREHVEELNSYSLDLTYRQELQASYFSFGLYEDALALSEESIGIGRDFLTEKDTNFPVFLFNLATAQLKLKRYQEALDSLEQYVATTSKLASDVQLPVQRLVVVRRWKAETLFNLGRYNEAITVINKNIDQLNSYPDIYGERLSAHWQLMLASEKKGDVAEARQAAIEVEKVRQKILAKQNSDILSGTILKRIVGYGVPDNKELQNIVKIGILWRQFYAINLRQLEFRLPNLVKARISKPLKFKVVTARKNQLQKNLEDLANCEYADRKMIVSFVARYEKLITLLMDALSK